MRQVRTCDFCGDDATGVYEPLPSSIPDAPRMLLCDACRDRLSSVVDPLLARIEGDLGPDAGGRSGGGPSDRGEATAYADLDDESRDDASGRSARDDLEAREWPDDPRERAEEGRDAPEGADGAPAASGSPGQPSDERGQPTDERSQPEAEPNRSKDDPAASSRATGRAAEPAPDEAGSDDTAPPPSSIDDPTDDGVDVSESRDASGRTQRERGGAPRGYRKVLRFLENRQLPVERAEAERLAADAYDLDVGEVEAALDHAVQYGRLREVSGELRR